MKSRAAAMNVYPDLWTRWVWHKQPIDALALDAPDHDGSPLNIARQVYHRMLCRIACAALWDRLVSWSVVTLFLAIGGGLLSIAQPAELFSFSFWPFLLFFVALVVLIWMLPGRLMAGLIDDDDRAEVAGVVRRAFLRDIPADTPADLVDVWRHGWLTSEGRPIAAELTEADGRASPAGEFAAMAGAVIFLLAAAIGSLGGSLLLAGAAPMMILTILFFARNPLIERGQELEVQEAVEGIAYSQAGGQPWAMALENARTIQLEEAKRDKSPLVQLGTTTGLLAARGDSFAPSAGLPLAASLRDLQLHLIAFGGTGAGKTTGVLVPIARAVSSWDNVGLLVLDGKGALPKELEDMDLSGFKVIDPEVETLSLVNGLEPQAVIETIATILGGAGASENGSFWIDSAGGLLRRAAVVAHALGGAHWCLSGIAAIAFQDDKRKAALESIPGLEENKRVNAVLHEAVTYLHKEWPTLDEKTRSNIIATARAWITTITAHGDLLRWAKSTGPDSVDLLAPLNGGRVGLLLPAYRYGKAGAVVTALLKARFFAKIKARAEDPSWPDRESPIVMLMDEAQEIATEEDATMLAIGRSLGLSVIAATQTVEGVTERLGLVTSQKWLTIFGNALALSGRSNLTDEFMADRAGHSWRLTVEEVEGLPVRTAIDANVATGVLAAARNQPSMAEAVALPGTALAKTAWNRVTQPIAHTLASIGGAAPGQALGASNPKTKLGPRPVLEQEELQSLLAEPDTALALLTRGRVVRRDVVKLHPYRPARSAKPEAENEDAA